MTILDIFNTIVFLLADVLTFIINIFIKRDKKVYLFGAGEQLRGNARFLFCYLSRNKEKYGIKKVVWVTRSSHIYDELHDGGFEVYKIHSPKSFYYHFRAGVVFTVNGYYTTRVTGKKVYGACMGQFTLGSAHINLNHGAFPIKSNNRVVTRDEQTLFWRIIVDIFQFFHGIHFFRHYMMYPGGSDESLLINANKYQNENEMTHWYKNAPITRVIAGFPELGECLFFTKEEKRLLESIKKKNKKKVIIYLPTYRTITKTQYTHPLNSPELCRFLKENDYLWIDKMTVGAMEFMLADNYNPDYSIALDRRFDINAVLPLFDMIITDYSRVGIKGVYHNMPIILYTPDIDKYNKYDKGVNQDFIENTPGRQALTIPELIDSISYELRDDYMVEMKAEYEKAMGVFFDSKRLDYDYLMAVIQNYINKYWRGTDLGRWKVND